MRNFLQLLTISRPLANSVGKPPPKPMEDSYIKSQAQDRKEQRESEAEKVKKGWKIVSGGKTLWRGEKYGAVEGVPVGTVFGEGDWQRAGRMEMAENGFFAPVVQPEWLEPNGCAYAVILNNDNGSSSDNGDEASLFLQNCDKSSRLTLLFGIAHAS